ncbi:hypothetical protein [Aminobacter sp. Piv2-1]|uniref:hypothetical protein n=1 Tax=Aminobacter sp. Piv2-1 TaxID=3031122 RepID=UPI00309D2BC2
MFLQLIVASIISFSIILPFLPRQTSVELTRADAEKLLLQNLRTKPRNISLDMACGTERMGRFDEYNGGCRNVEIFSKFINQFGEGVVSVNLIESPQSNSLSVLFAPSDFKLLPDGQYTDSVEIANDCALVTLRNQSRIAKYIHIGPKSKNIMRCLTIGFFSEIGVEFKPTKDTEESIDYILAYILLISPTSDYEEALRFANTILSRNNISMEIRE